MTLKKLGAKNPEALAWSAMAEMAGALTLSRAVSDPKTSNAILRKFSITPHPAHPSASPR